MPEPEEREHLVVDHVEVEDADGVLHLQTPSNPGVPVVVAGGNLGEHLAHRVSCGVQ